MLCFFHDFFGFLELFQPQNNSHADLSMENGSELRDVDKIICWEMGYNMNREIKTPCREFVSSRAEAGLEKDSTREDEKYYEGESVYRVLGN